MKTDYEDLSQEQIRLLGVKDAEHSGDMAEHARVLREMGNDLSGAVDLVRAVSDSLFGQDALTNTSDDTAPARWTGDSATMMTTELRRLYDTFVDTPDTLRRNGDTLDNLTTKVQNTNIELDQLEYHRSAGGDADAARRIMRDAAADYQATVSGMDEPKFYNGMRKSAPDDSGDPWTPGSSTPAGNNPATPAGNNPANPPGGDPANPPGGDPANPPNNDPTSTNVPRHPAPPAEPFHTASPDGQPALQSHAAPPVPNAPAPAPPPAPAPSPLAPNLPPTLAPVIGSRPGNVPPPPPPPPRPVPTPRPHGMTPPVIGSRPGNVPPPRPVPTPRPHGMTPPVIGSRPGTDPLGPRPSRSLPPPTSSTVRPVIGSRPAPAPNFRPAPAPHPDSVTRPVIGSRPGSGTPFGMPAARPGAMPPTRGVLPPVIGSRPVSGMGPNLRQAPGTAPAARPGGGTTSGAPLSRSALAPPQRPMVPAVIRGRAAAVPAAAAKPVDTRPTPSRTVAARVIVRPEAEPSSAKPPGRRVPVKPPQLSAAAERAISRGATVTAPGQDVFAKFARQRAASEAHDYEHVTDPDAAEEWRVTRPTVRGTITSTSLNGGSDGKNV